MVVLFLVWLIFGKSVIEAMEDPVWTELLYLLPFSPQPLHLHIGPLSFFQILGSLHIQRPPGYLENIVGARDNTRTLPHSEIAL